MATRLTSTQPLSHLTVDVPAGSEDAAGAVLQDLFGQQPVEFWEPDSDRVQLSLFRPVTPPVSRSQRAELLARLLALKHFGIPIGQPRIRVRPLAARNWKESWKRHFKPLEIGRRLLLRPSWSRRRAKPGQSVVVLDPGLSFGTGQHPTTTFCLRELVRARAHRKPQSFLDIGTGSGILAIAAAKLGYAPVHGFDVDPDAVRVARTNARRNRVEGSVRLGQADLSLLPLRSRQQQDVVCANLLADLLIRESARILNRVKPGGLLVLAGILEREFLELEQHYVSLGARPLRSRTEGEWCSGAYRVVS